jgi:tRNA pseudouridine55 synthase
MVGDLELPVPAFSAIKRGGQPLYKKARRGIKIDLPIKVMKIISAKIVKTKFNKKTQRVHVWIDFHVGSGTYIRSLAENFGERVGLPATLGNLRRTQVGEFSIKKSYRI